MNIKPMGSFLLIRLVSVENITPGGVYIAGKADLAIAEVMDKGEGDFTESGARIPIKSEIGDLITYNITGAIFKDGVTALMRMHGHVDHEDEFAYLDNRSVLGTLDNITKEQLTRRKPIILTPRRSPVLA